MQWLNAIIQGILLGGLYALLAAGLSLMFGVMRIVNLAHGVLAMLAAYLGVVFVNNLGLPWFLALVIVVPIMAAVGYVLQWGLFNRAISKGGLAPLLVAFGLAVVLTQLLQQIFSADSRSIQIGALGTSSIQVSDTIYIGWFPLMTFVVGVLVIAGVQVFLNRAPLGRAMRATSDDPETVNLMGINNRQVYALATALAMATVGLAGMFIGTKTQFIPTYGDLVLIFAFEAVIIGGLGSLWGTLVGGIILGVAQTVGSQINPSYGLLVGNLVFLAILAFRPQGLLPKAVTT
ncbi:MAG: branched-chain amino acid ABC transporter permease [Actinomycetales bacterium]|nr:branched-chain amino acid ABC transporter permease [Actinomycetales bacterium]